MISSICTASVTVVPKSFRAKYGGCSRKASKNPTVSPPTCPFFCSFDATSNSRNYCKVQELHSALCALIGFESPWTHIYVRMPAIRQIGEMPNLKENCKNEIIAAVLSMFKIYNRLLNWIWKHMDTLKRSIIIFLTPERQPALFRITYHSGALGTWCLWSKADFYTMKYWY